MKMSAAGAFGKRILSSLALIFLLAMPAANSATGRDVGALEFDFNIPAQSLTSALLVFSAQTGLQVVTSGATLPSRDTSAVKGRQTIAAALGQLLSGTNLKYQAVSDTTITIVPAGRRTSAANADGSIHLAQAERNPSSTGSTDEPSESAPRTAQVGSIEVEEVIVSGSRLDRRGFETPTPTLTLTDDDLRAGARPTIAAVLNDLPQFRASASPQALSASLFGGQAGVDLRGLGFDRTLTLLDGRRVASSNQGADLNLIPSLLVKRVDVVTGGASAAWGSGAVAGVVNIILDTNLQGIRLGVQGARSTHGDGGEERFELAAGTGFADDRGHVIFGGEFVDNDGVRPMTARDNVGRWAQVTRPGQPGVLTPDVGRSDASLGGLILTGVNAGRTFNADGTLRAFDFGEVVGSSSIGGEGPSNDDTLNLTAPLTRYNALGRVTYALTDWVKASVEVRHGRVYNNYSITPDPVTPLTISVDNAFLPAAVRSQMVAAGETSLRLGRFNTDFALTHLDFERQTTQATVAFDGTLGAPWRWSVYLSHGEFDDDFDLANLRIDSSTNPAFRNFRNAVDAVVNPATGQPACAINVDANPGNDDAACAPINLFGEGNASQAALAYVLGTGTRRLHRELSLGGLSLRGEPFDNWAGPVSVAVGVDARHETQAQEAGALDLAQAFLLINQGAFPTQSLTTREAFAETLLPLLKDVPFFRRLDFNGAARLTDDVTGSVWSWKLGLTDQIVDGLTLRLARSRDIRAPSLNNLFDAAALPSTETIFDPQTGQSYPVLRFSGSNRDLKPEEPDTTTIGVTIAPPGVPGLRFTADYYDIEIDNVIANRNAQQIAQLCFAGNLLACGQITRDSSGRITVINSRTANLTLQRATGIDVALDYALPLSEISGLPGTLRIRTTGTWVDQLYTDDRLFRTDLVGTTNQTAGVPSFRGGVSLFYDTQGTQTTLRTRYISSANFNEAQNILNNRIDSYTYVDLGFRLTRPLAGLQTDFYFDIVNLFDEEPPIASRFSPYYDLVGRYVTLGAHLKF